MRLAILIDLTQPIPRRNLVARLGQWFKFPLTLIIKRRSVIAPLQKNSFHPVQVMLQSIVVFGKDTRTEGCLQHVLGEFNFCIGLQPSGTFENLDISLIAHYLNDLSHQLNTSLVDVTDFVLGNRSVHLYNDQV